MVSMELAHYFVSNEARTMLEKKHNTRIIVCHLGNGSSVSAVFNGKCIDTSMGLTPIQGLMMGKKSWRYWGWSYSIYDETRTKILMKFLIL